MSDTITRKSLFSERTEYQYPDRPELNWTSHRELRPWARAAAWFTGIALLLSLICGAVYGGFAYDRARCRTKAERLGLVEQWEWRVGCQVRMPDGRVVDIDKIRFNENGSPS